MSILAKGMADVQQICSQRDAAGPGGLVPRGLGVLEELESGVQEKGTLPRGVPTHKEDKPDDSTEKSHCCPKQSQR